jgi:DNA replication protein DnaC
MEARDERRLRALQKHLSMVKLLIVDELGYVPFTAVGSELELCWKLGDGVKKAA